jgi:aminoglycoside phosphotransferase family enzyme
LGAPRIGRLIFETYSEKTGDQPPGDLLLFYKSFHACLRAKIAVWHLKDHDALDWAKWTGKAKRYLELAACIMNQGAPLSSHPNGCS